MRPTSRRETLAASAAAASLLAGCVSGTEDGDDSNGDADPYEVSMAPVGTVEFDSVPETYLSYESTYAEMGVALGVGDGLRAVGNKGRFLTGNFDELGIPYTSGDELAQLWDDGIDVERFYDLDVDVHLVDPNWFEYNFGSLDADDVDEIASIAPFVGNTIFRRTDSWHDYEYYTLYEAFEKIAKVFQREDRYEAFSAYHDEILESVDAALPPASERPNAVAIYGGEEPDQFSPGRIDGGGVDSKHFRDLGLEDAFAGTGVEGISTNNRTQIGYETLLDVDPDVIFLRGHEHKSRDEFESTTVAYMEDHGLGGDLTAVEAGRVYRAGPVYLGPISHLFTLERVAGELFPDRFDGPLFDRDRVGDIVTGDA
ncbi:ABC transporter substrate-binding protein [Halovivax limisalsi]|uniref:ABC transporter substrate-binding protein n=1 Tax=Halovivax limisalsi TaxID=1453760 RepID=UPI001FFCFEA5|nr:ABC transporter substrate-binding protein [Halovivax limisalsi]